MSLSRSLALARVARRSGRTFATAADAGGDYYAQRAAIKAHAAETTELWRKISFYVCMPITHCLVVVGAAWVKKAEDAHHEHTEHLKHENDGHLPETPAYSYLNKRDKPFPWGMNSLFFNPEVQKDMSGAGEE
ncbi:mitochondrial cytochrome c oxidase subunit VIa [Ceratobasidium sp. AG-I]|nr:mitochondrial cytochrome c oxidase subunit VIa [Ceratobasidium sp. AG-I]